jgi:hypothetical protein
MFDELKKYKENKHFFFQPTDSLKEVCNAPSDKSGVYLVYALKNGRIELMYIGRSGKISNDGSMFIRKAGPGGLKDSIVNGHQFGKIPRHKSWPARMLKEGIEALDIYWYTTHCNDYNDCPGTVAHQLLTSHFKIFERLPKWNKEI